ncbi:MAG: tetratricopeptide repeat protein [Chitinophagaceae bacterium]|nr:tetratricopeptide repeat protein [Chitinophagaceae bacterium]
MKQLILIIVVVCFGTFQLQAQADAELYNKALAFKKERKCAEAIPVLLKLLELKPDHSKALNDIGWCYNETAQFAKAVPHLQKAIALDSTDASAFGEIGYSYYSLQQYDLSVEHLNKANQFKPKTETTVYYLGLCYVKKNNKAEAVKKYNELSLMNSSYAGKLLEEIKEMK